MTFISTSGHGYLKITINQLKSALKKGFKPTSFSFMNSKTVLLEEDLDAPSFLDIMFEDLSKEEINKKIKIVSQNNINKNKYSKIAQSLSELNNILSIYNKKLWKKGDIMFAFDDKKLAIEFSHKNGYVYKENNEYYLMPFHYISKIESI